MPLASFIYAGIARRRRGWYAARADRRVRLDRPVVSVGNVAVGGSGKTPVAALVARLLLESGHRPSILSRGYARRRPSDGVTVVSDGRRVLADLDHAGDEPLMLARALPGVPVLVSADRYLAGRLAERRLGCTVHVLDDGFQHVRLERDVDLVLLSPEDVARPVTLPSGRLREPLDVVRLASALVVGGADASLAADIGARVGVGEVFVLSRALGRPRWIGAGPGDAPPGREARALAVAGVARPERFFAALEADGWTVAGRLAFDDHHQFRRSDVDAVAAAMRASQADLVLTTEKDAVRLEPLGPLPVPVAAVPLEASVEPAGAFASWLRARVGEPEARSLKPEAR